MLLRLFCRSRDALAKWYQRTVFSTDVLPYIAFVLSFILLAIAYLYFGWQLGGDTDRYLNRGTSLILTWVGDAGDAPLKLDIYTIQYLIPNLTFASMHLAWNDLSYIVSIATNVILFSTISLLIFKIWKNGCQPRISILFVALGLYLTMGLPGEVLKWNYVAFNPDILLMTMVTMLWMFLVKAINQRSAKPWIAACIIATLCVFTKPAGIAVFVFFCVISFYLGSIPHGLLRRNTGPPWLGLFVLPSLAVFLIWPGVIYATQFEISWLDSFVSHLPRMPFGTYHRGMVVKGLLDTYVESPDGYLDYVAVAVYRFLYLIALWRPGYSTAHIVANLVYIAFLLWAMRTGWRHLHRAGSPHALFASALVACSYYFTLFHVATVVDDWRYQLPVWPPLWILAGYGLINKLAFFGDPSGEDRRPLEETESQIQTARPGPKNRTT